MWKIVFVLLASIALNACVQLYPQAGGSKLEYYLVQPGDNIYSIAFALEITAEQLLHTNPWLRSEPVTPGMRLSVPSYRLHNNTAKSDTGYGYGYGNNQFDEIDRVTIQGLNAEYIWPVLRVEITSHYGYRRGSLHAGIDLRAPRGTRIYASAAGKVIFSGIKPGYGRIIVIDHGNGIETAYAHNSRNLAKKGQSVMQGQLVATVGRSGNATGYHVHFEFRRYGQAVNPIPHLRAAL